jgi:hypothetical protein
MILLFISTIGWKSGDNLQSRSRTQQDSFKIPLVKISCVKIILLSEKGGMGEVSRAILRSRNNPPFEASLCINVSTQTIAVNVPEVVST